MQYPTFHTVSQNRNAEELGFCDPSELRPQMPHQYRNVKIALVVAHKNIGLCRIDMRHPPDGNADPAHPEYGLPPQPADAMHCILGVRKERKDGGRCPKEECGQYGP